MSFQGDVAQIPLSNILQALLLNGQEGMLLLDDGVNKHRLRVLKQGLRLLNYSAEEHDFLRRLLVKQRVLTEAQFANIFSAWTPGSMCGGDFLLSRRILTRDVVLTDLFRQIENTILELVTTRSLKYEFKAAADAAPYELFSPEDVGQYLILNPNAVLMEAVRRDDEWARIRGAIPSPHMVFAVTDRGALSAKNLPVEARCLRELKPLLTGEYTLERLCELTPLCSFEVHDTIFKLKQLGLVTPLTSEQKAQVAERLRKSLRNSDAVALLRSMLVDYPGDAETRSRLIALLDKEPQAAAEVAAHHLFLADKLRQEQPDQARAHVDRALAIDAGHLGALEISFELAHASGSQREALAALRAVADVARTAPPRPEATALFSKLIAHYPDDAPLRHELADLHLAQGNNDAAYGVLQGLADLYKRRKDAGKFRKTCEQLARLRPADSARLRRASKVGLRRRVSGRRCLRTALTSALVVGTCAAALVLGHYEYQARVAFAAIGGDVARHKMFGAIDSAKKSLAELEALFPLSTCTRTAQGQMTELNRLAYVQQEERRKEAERRRVQADSAYTRASLAYDSNELGKALELLTTIDLSALPTAKVEEAKGLRQRIERHFEEAKRLLRLSEDAERNNDYVASYQNRRTLCLEFPNVPLTAALRLPIRVESVPPGATVTIDGEPVGETPILLSVPWRKTPALILQRSGYKSFHLNRDPIQGVRFNPLSGHTVRITLNKAVAWQFDAGASIEVAPLLAADSLYVATRGGKVFCLSQESGQVTWSYATPQNMDISGGLGYWNGFIYFGAFDGRIYILDTFTGKPASEPIPATAEGWPIKAAPSQPSERGVVAFNCDRRMVSAYSLHKRSPAWSFTVPDAQFLGQPQAANDRVYVCTTRGELYVLSQETGTVERKMALGYELKTRGKLAANGRYFVAGPGSNLLSLDPLQQHIDWSIDLPAPLAAPPTVEGDVLIVQTTAGSLHCLTTSGELKWSGQLPSLSGPETEGVIFRSNYFLGTRSGLVLCHDLWSGVLLWDYKTAGHADREQRSITGAGVVGKGRLFIGSEDHYLYCLTIE